MTNEPLVTIYILNHNYQDYLKQCLDSALKQTYKNIELFVIDDGSTDDSSTILAEYELKVGLTVYRQKNLGLVASIRKAFSIAKGDYVIRIDADDWVTEDFIELLVQRALNKNAAIVFPDYIEVDADSNLLHRVSRFDFENEVQVYDTPAHGACTLVEKKAYLDIGGHLEGIVCQDGVDLWLSMTEAHKVTNLNKPLFYYRQHSASITQNNAMILKNRVAIFSHHAHKRIGYHKVAGVILLRSDLCLEFYLQEDVVYLLDQVIKNFNSSTTINDIFIVCDNPMASVAKKVVKNFSKTCQIHTLPLLSNLDKKLRIEDILKKLSKNEIFDTFDCMISQSIYFPLIRPAYIDLATYTALIHGFIIVETVVENNDVVYRHDGTGLIEISDPSERQERLSLYVRNGGITCYLKNDNYKKNNLGKGHVVIDRHASFYVGNLTDLAIAKIILEQVIHYEKN